MMMENIGSELREKIDGLRTSVLSESRDAALHRLSITELQTAFGRGALEPRRLVTHYLDRIEAYNAKLSAFVEVDHNQIERALLESERRFADEAQRPLEGIPVAISSEVAVVGLCHHAGMAARENEVAVRDACIVQRLRDAGAIILGTLNVEEALVGGDTDNPFLGRTKNPHSLDKSAGGACGGAAVAVAAGLCVAAIGADRMGSLRVPAARCGVFALVATPHQVSSQGIWPLSQRFDSVGAVTRSMEDISFLTNVLFAPDLATAMRRSRYLRLASYGDLHCSPDIVATFDAALTLLPESPGDLCLEHKAADIADSFYALLIRDLVSDLVSLGEEACNSLSDRLGAFVTPVIDREEAKYGADEDIVNRAISTMRQIIASNGVLLMPSTQHVVSVPGETNAISGADFALLANLAGMPSVQVPIGRDSSGMPVGLLLVGPVGGESMVVAQARMINDQFRGYAPPNDLDANA